MVRSSSGGVAIRYVLPVLWMTSRLTAVGRMAGVAIPGWSLMSTNALLDFSGAFDTASHSTLLTVLQQRFGVCDYALSWFESYLSVRTQNLYVNGVYIVWSYRG